MRNWLGILIALALVIAGCSRQGPLVVDKAYTIEALVPGSAMHGVHGLAFDKAGRLYGASLTGYSIYEIDTRTGAVSTKVGPPLGNADDVAVAPDGTIAWTAGAYSAVHALTPAGEIKVLASDLPAVNSINYSPAGRLFVTRVFGGDALYEIDPEGAAEPRLIAKQLGGLNGFEVTAENKLYGPLFLRGKLVEVDVDSGDVREIGENFTVPAAVNLDSQGRLYVVDFDDGTILRVSKRDGSREEIVRLEPPLDNLAISADDQIYVSNPATNTITAVDPDRGTTRVVTAGHLSSPGGVALAEHAGRQQLLVADFWGNRYFDTTSGERTMLEVPDGVTASASLAAQGNHLALASIWPFGLVYVIDKINKKIVKTAKFTAPYSPVFEADGSLLVADYGAGTITRLAPGKDRGKEVIAEGLEGPVGLAVSGGQVYVSEFDAGRISRIVAGEREVILDGLQQPEGLALDQSGAVLIAETGTGRLLRADPSKRTMTVIAENLPIGLAGGDDLPSPFLPTGVAVDGGGTIFISADIENSIYKLSRR
jgi:sugar lactone lactonase YvrE